MSRLPLRDGAASPEEVRMSEETVKKMLTELLHEIDLGTLVGTSANFIKSLSGFYQSRGHLTPKQQFYLRKHYFQMFPEPMGGQGGTQSE